MSQVTSLHLAAVGRADKSPECLHVGTAEGLILKYTLSISGATIGAASKVSRNSIYIQDNANNCSTDTVCYNAIIYFFNSAVSWIRTIWNHSILFAFFKSGKYFNRRDRDQCN